MIPFRAVIKLCHPIPEAVAFTSSLWGSKGVEQQKRNHCESEAQPQCMNCTSTTFPIPRWM